MKSNKNKYKWEKAKEISFWSKLQNFFFPKDFKYELARGAQISSPYGIGNLIYKGAFGVGKLARKVVNPRRKVLKGKEKR